LLLYGLLDQGLDRFWMGRLLLQQPDLVIVHEVADDRHVVALVR